MRNTIQLRQTQNILLGRRWTQNYSTQPTTTLTPSTSTNDPSSSQLPPPPLLPVRPSTSKHGRPTTQKNLRLGAAGLLSRSPLLLKPLTEFENSYYQYQRELNQALSKPIKSSFFFRPGSHAAKAFELSIKKSTCSQLDPLPNHSQDDPKSSDNNNDDFHNIQRNPTRFIHLFFKLLDVSNQKVHWLLPTSKILGSWDDLTKASLRAIHKNAGPDMDIWSVGRVPATVYKPSLDSDFRFDKVWIMPQRILRGQPKLLVQSSSSNSSTQNQSFLHQEQSKQKDDVIDDENRFKLQDFGWFSADEIKDLVHLDLWNSLQPILK